MSTTQRYLSFDTETTGLGPSARIVEIALVLFEDGKVVDSWSQMIWPIGVEWDDPKVREALAVNQIDLEVLAAQPTFEQTEKEIGERMQGCPLWVAHNAEFDLRMLGQEFQRLGHSTIPFQPALTVCTMLLSSKAHPTAQSHRLSAVAPRWGVKQEDAHRAEVDAIACGQVFHAMLRAGAVPSDLYGLEAFQKEASAARRTRRR